MSIAYLGPRGTFTEQACRRYIDQQSVTLSVETSESMVDLFEKLIDGDVEKIIVPIENSIEGSVNATMDLLSKSNGVYLNEEIILPIEQCLLAKTGVALADITHVVSHPQALAQCRDTLRKIWPEGITIQAVSSTAIGAKQLQNGDLESTLASNKIGVIGNQTLAKEYDLAILEAGINDKKNNATRFMVISKAEAAPSGNDKTSLIVSAIKDKPGGLVEILQAFSKRDINLSRIVSRPNQNILGEYVFFIDCDGHKDTAEVSAALDEIKENASYFKLLGSYKQDTHHA